MKLFEDDDHYSASQFHNDPVPAAPSLRSAFAEPLNHWCVRVLCGVAGLPAYWERNTAVQAIDTSWLMEVIDVQGEEAANCLSSIPNLKAQLLKQRDALQPGTVWPAYCAPAYNLNWLFESAGLTTAERQILLLAYSHRVFGLIRNVCAILPNMTRLDLPQVLGDLLQIEASEVRNALSLGGKLLGCSLLSTYATIDGPLHNLMQMSRNLANRITLYDGPPEALMNGFCQPLPETTLSLDDYPHMQGLTELARHWLRGAIGESGKTGAHLLIHGAPGLGKTEWVRALVQAEGVIAQELAVLGESEDVLTGDERIEHLKMCMQLLSGHERSVMVFDEADDAFNSRERETGQGHSVANHRAHLNRMLETSPVPVIWIMNHAHILDPAMLRRFDVVIGFDAMPRSQKIKMLKQRPLAELANDAEISRWADIDGLTPALIDRLERVVRRAQTDSKPLEVRHCRHWISQRIDERSARLLTKVTIPTQWKPERVNASVNLEKLIAGIQASGSARILLHGAPGTGKTEFAKELARRLDKPLLEKRASDLLSAWVGETEKQIEGAFAEAQRQDAVLFIDEVDSLVFKRDAAQRSWEVTMVNELLVQLGDFEGLVVLATNRLDALDAAVLRRMDAKVAFAPWTVDQLTRAFNELIEELKLPAPSIDQSLELLRIRGLTVGDLACVKRRLRFDALGASPITELITSLKAEVSLREGNKQPVGFVQDTTLDDSTI